MDSFCNERGWIVPINETLNVCSCFDGFYGYQCETTMKEAFPEWVAFQVIISVVYFIMSCMWAYALYKYYIRKSKPEDQSIVNINRYSLIMMIAYFNFDFGSFLTMAIDPFGELTAAYAPSFWTAYSNVVGFILLGSILCYWVETFHAFQAKQKQIMQIQKINSNYEPEMIRFDEIQKTMGNMNRWRWPFIGIIIIDVILQCIWLGLLIHTPGIASIVQYLTYGIITLSYIVYATGFIIYERKIRKILGDSQLKAIIHHTSVRVNFFCAVSLAFIIPYAIWGILFPGPLSTAIFRLVVVLQQFVVTFGIWTIYIPVTFPCWRKKKVQEENDDEKHEEIMAAVVSE
eukprot:TRINITY_DN626_c0_g1_i1.p1 TRINITY_DN626_c0_g1~~TRINITY_DN626_c0_g1_i1.p1  ORF type:complete len:345 (+),score=82.74 TRINITY_DN626_c0_g1_i1:52-1086(+)